MKLIMMKKNLIKMLSNFLAVMLSSSLLQISKFHC